ncbi:MAG: hypothetical protein AAF543_07385 [Pseudomonadota bacterium]
MPVNLTLMKFDESASQIVISPIEENFWRDLWLLEINCFEAPNIANRIVGLLDELDIRIISMSSCRIHHGYMHAVTIICDCSNYDSRYDRSLQRRISLKNPNLDELEAILVSELIENLVIYDGEIPAISLKRLNPYHELYLSPDSMRHRNYIKVDDEGSMEIPKQFIKEIRRICSCDDNDHLYYQISVDTRDRLVRINFLRTSDNIYIFRVLFDSNAFAMKDIFDIISINDFDIVGCQMNFLSNGYVEDLSVENENYFTLDIALRSLKYEPRRQDLVVKDLVEQMRERKGDAIQLDEESLRSLLCKR